LNDCLDAVAVHACAAGREHGAVEFTSGTHVLNHVVSGSASAGQQDAELFPLARPLGSETVEVVTIDELVGDRMIAAMKIDVEGFEEDVVEGAQRALRDHRIGYLQIECNDLSLTHYGRSSAPVWDLLRSCGYTLHRLDADGALLLQPETPHPGEVIAVSPDESFRSRLEARA
jgi:FkbM family methyltransferase